MDVYREMYAALFNRVTDAPELLELGKPRPARELLKLAQLETEEMFVSRPGGEETR